MIFVAMSFFLTVRAQKPGTRLRLSDSLLLKNIRLFPSSGKEIFINYVPANYASSCYGFFCRQELRLEKTIKFPLKFRLGDLEYANKLEGKK
jgi:hypothetical protein